MPNRWVRENAIESDAVNSVSWQSEVFWRRLLNRADDFGRYSANLKLLRTQIFPLQIDKVAEMDVARLLSECEKAGLLFVYEASGKPYLVLNKWEKGRAKKSKCPDPPPEIRMQMQTFIYKCEQMQTNAPTSDPDFRVPTTAPDSDAREVGDFEVEPPPGFPKTAVEASHPLQPIVYQSAGKPTRIAPPEFLAGLWEETAGRNYRDRQGQAVGRWHNYASGAWSRKCQWEEKNPGKPYGNANYKTAQPNPRNAGIAGDAEKRTAAIVAKVARMQEANKQSGNGLAEAKPPDDSHSPESSGSG